MEPTFFDRFIVHLALELLQDAQQVQDWLQSSTTTAQNPKKSSKLYWRSSPQPPNHQQPCFVDVTFTIASNGPSPKIQMQFGYLNMQTNSSGTNNNDEDSSSSSTYCCCRDPFSPDDLNKHTTSLDLVLDEADPRALSASLARALKSKLRLGQEDGNWNSLQCYYDELDQWGCLLRRSGGHEGGRMSESKLDGTCTNLLLQNLRTFDGSDNQTIRELDRTAVDHALQQYWAQWNDSSATATAVDEPLVVAPPVSSNSSAKAMVVGYRQIPNNKRRRRGLSELKLKGGNS